jgi:r-opsin
VISCWLYGVLWCIVPTFTKHGFVPEGFLTSCTFDYISQDVATHTSIVLMVGLGFLLPVLMMTIFYTLIFVHIRSHVTTMRADLNRSTIIRFSRQVKPIKIIDKQSDPSRTRVSYRKQLTNELKVMRSSIVMVAIFCIGWLPYAVIVLVAQFSPNRSAYVTPRTAIIPTLFAKLSSVLNPIVYGLTNREMSKYAKSLFSRKRQAKASTVLLGYVRIRLEKYFFSTAVVSFAMSGLEIYIFPKLFLLQYVHQLFHEPNQKFDRTSTGPIELACSEPKIFSCYEPT